MPRRGGLVADFTHYLKDDAGRNHCWSRCVQKAFLCGYDPETKVDFGYRRPWMEDLLAYQATVFAIDVGNFSLPSSPFAAPRK